MVAGVAGEHVVGDAQRAVTTGDDHRPIGVDPLLEQGSELVGVARRDADDVGIQAGTHHATIRRVRSVVGRAGGRIEDDGRRAGEAASGSP